MRNAQPQRPRRSSISGIEMDMQEELDALINSFIPVVHDSTNVSSFASNINEDAKMKSVDSIAIKYEESSESNGSMESGEQNDVVSPMYGDPIEWTSFRQIDYLWLFDP